MTPDSSLAQAKARHLALDLPRLQRLHEELRGRLERSPLMDGARFARQLEAAYRRMANVV